MTSVHHICATRPTTSERITRFAFLDYLRIFAFSSVLFGHKFFHYLEIIYKDPDTHATVKLFSHLLMHLTFSGGVGVVVFFLVSGYIIAHVLQTDEPGEFLLKRLFRIYPLYVVAVMLEYLISLDASQRPSLATLLAQLLLIGDIFGTPYSLNGAEWTLRIEVVFYIVMACLRATGFMTRFKRSLPWALAACVLLWASIAPIPDSKSTYLGYTSTYGVLLFIGSAFYLYEHSRMSLILFFGLVILALFHHYRLTVIYLPNWKELHFAAIALTVFTICWWFREYLTSSIWVKKLSDLTFSVYLFHHWIFDYFWKLLKPLNFTLIHLNLQALILLMLVCYAAVHCIEKPGIRLGKAILNRLKSPTDACA